MNLVATIGCEWARRTVLFRAPSFEQLEASDTPF
jgi:glutathionyl-hydroquinone reductase